MVVLDALCLAGQNEIGAGIPYVISDPKNAGRLPSYRSFDISVDRNFRVIRFDVNVDADHLIVFGNE